MWGCTLPICLTLNQYVMQESDGRSRFRGNYLILYVHKEYDCLKKTGILNILIDNARLPKIERQSQ